MKRTYLFDFDGTLVDSMPAYIGGMLKILDGYNVKYENEIVKIITPLGFNGTAEYYLKTFGLKTTKADLLKQMQDNMIDEYFYNILPKEGVVETLKTLKTQGHSLNVLTASPHITLDACLKRIGIYDLFDNVWSCDDFATTKADPKIYQMSAERLGVNVSDVLFLDDNINADKTAKVAGMKVCGVYDKTSDDYVEEMKKATDFYIFNFKELLNIEF